MERPFHPFLHRMLRVRVLRRVHEAPMSDPRRHGGRQYRVGHLLTARRQRSDNEEAAMPEQRVGVIGLGSMGRGIGKNVVAKGFPTTVYDANLAAIEPLQMLGAEGAETPRAVAERSDVVITVLPNGPDVEAVAFGPDGIVEGAKPGTILMDCSTIDPAVSLSVNRALRERGIRMVDAS